MTYDVAKSFSTLGGDKGCFIYCAQPPLNGIACPTKKSLSFEAREHSKHRILLGGREAPGRHAL
jgi:hypothetical protein